MENEIRKNCFCLHWLAEKAGYNNHFGVYGFESITSALYGYTEPVCLSPILITAGCNSSMFDYELGIKCEYHEEIECTCCTLLTVKRCCYWMTNTFSGIYNVDITESHLPVKSQSSFSEVCLV
uniref:Maelstrom domain-containing protein n=1 Tax=Ciona intestinalis TaxID=7719 RepID=F6QD88_CIOIN